MVVKHRKTSMLPLHIMSNVSDWGGQQRSQRGFTVAVLHKEWW
jgi:hypothetical protein